MHTPAEVFDLVVDGRCTIDGIEYVVYNDGQFRDAVLAADFDCDVPMGVNYSVWCRACRAITDAPLLGRIFAACSIRGGRSAATGTYVLAAQVVNRYADMSPADVYATLVGEQPVADFAGDVAETEIDAYIACSPTCADLTDAERVTVRAKLLSVCA